MGCGAANGTTREEEGRRAVREVLLEDAVGTSSDEQEDEEDEMVEVKKENMNLKDRDNTADDHSKVVNRGKGKGRK